MKRGNILEMVFKSRKTFEECAGKKQIWSADRIENFSIFAVNLSSKSFLPQINGTVRIYKMFRSNNMVFSDYYNSTEFIVDLKVEFNGVTTNWLCLKKSRIPNSGLGVFALRVFKKNEFITVYLGIKETNILETEYVFHGINGRVGNEVGCLKKEFWFAHRIQHGSGQAANVKIKENYSLIALRDLRIGEELFFDYNRNINCPSCNKETGFCDNLEHSMYLCYDCYKTTKEGKICQYCHVFFCLKCYDKRQIFVN